MTSLLDQLKKRRKALGLKQHDMLLRVGMSRQQYQRLEAKGNPRLGTLELVAKGLKSELLLVPQEKLHQVMAVLEGKAADHPIPPSGFSQEGEHLSDDPWRDLLGDEE